MKYLSVCSGIEAASVAWKPIGWTPFAFSEIEDFPSKVLDWHYPDVLNLGDMTKFKEWPDANVDVLVGGTPCQSFSVAGLRKGLDDPRGNLMLTYLAITAKYRPRWLVWENVPGVLSSNGGRDFAALLRGLAECGYGFAYRVLDAQYFGVAQRRRRVFVVGCLGDWRAAAAVLFERHSLSGNPAPRRKAGEEVTGTISSRTTGGGGLGTDFECAGGLQPVTARMVAFGEYADDDSASALKARDYKDATDLVVQPYTLAIRGRGDDHNLEYRQDGTANALLTPNGGRGGIGVGAVAQPMPINTMIALRHNALGERTGFGVGEQGDPAFTITKAHSHAVAHKMKVRRLTPVECERLQGFPDGYTDIQPNGKRTPDGPRYKALGNSMAVPVMNWIGKRIQMVDGIHLMDKAA